MNWNKGALLETSGNYWKSCTLHAGVKLDIFSIIGSGTKTAEAVAAATGGELRGISALLNALVAMELLEKKENLYSCTAFSNQFLSKDSPDYTGYIILHHHHLVDSWSRLSESVISGHPSRSSVSHSGEEKERESFLMGMFNIAGATAPVYAKSLDFSGCTHLLDLGGGPGTYAIYFCLNTPGLKATIYDLATTRGVAEKTIDSFGLSDRIRFTDGNYLDERLSLEKEYDAVWMSHILHGEGPLEAEKIIAKAVAAMKPGGKIFIHEFILDDTLSGPLFPALFSLNMLVGTDRGQAYSESMLIQMLDNNGVKNIDRLDIKGPNDAGIITGIV